MRLLAILLCLPTLAFAYSSGGTKGCTDKSASSASAPTYTETTDLCIRVTTLGASFTTTLPAATTGQRVWFADGTRTAASNASGYIAALDANGSETFSTAGGAALTLYLSEDAGYVVLEGVAGTGWVVIGGSGYAVDVRTVGTGQVAWYMAQRGITLSSNRLVSQINDFSGNGHNATQATAAQQPSHMRVNGLMALACVRDTAGQRLVTDATQDISTEEVSIVALVAMNDPKLTGGATTYQSIMGWGSSGTTGMGLQMGTGATAQDWTIYDFLLFGGGSNSGRAPRVIGYIGPGSGDQPTALGYSQWHVFVGILSATASASDYWVDGNKIVNRVRTDGAVGTLTDQAIVICGDTSGGGSPLRGFLQTLIIYNTVLSGANRALLEGDLLRQAGGR